MLRVPAAQIFPDVEVGRPPEAGKIAGDLNWPMRGGEEMNGQGRPRAAEARRLGAPEHLLQAHGKHRRRRISVVDCDA
jgi:hypothetical protein